jgi:hypothetical protein
MNLYNAVSTGRPIKRPHHERFHPPGSLMYTVSEALADDWEVAPEPAKCCPFCGAFNSSVVSEPLRGVWVRCNQCLACGPMSADEPEAVSKWNFSLRGV